MRDNRLDHDVIGGENREVYIIPGCGRRGSE
jgi:hypothetical protein